MPIWIGDAQNFLVAGPRIFQKANLQTRGTPYMVGPIGSMDRTTTTFPLLETVSGLLLPAYYQPSKR